jgi:hypothetical protein
MDRLRTTIRSMVKTDIALVVGLVLLLAAVAFMVFGPIPPDPFTYSCPVGRVPNPPEQCRNNGNPAYQ